MLTNIIKLLYNNLDAVQFYDDYVTRIGQDLRGSSPIRDLIRYAERPTCSGLVLMDAPAAADILEDAAARCAAGRLCAAEILETVDISISRIGYTV
ncbi:MAG: UxaA family hydrolase [Clostridia bacterium]|nr:UxaA family hydrolase [Clostridia bacterium]